MYSNFQIGNVEMAEYRCSLLVFMYIWIVGLEQCAAVYSDLEFDPMTSFLVFEKGNRNRFAGTGEQRGWLPFSLNCVFKKFYQGLFKVHSYSQCIMTEVIDELPGVIRGPARLFTWLSLCFLY